MAPAFEPFGPGVVKATKARPVTGLMPTAMGASVNGLPFESAEGKLNNAVTFGTLRSMTASVALEVELALLATRARLRRLSTATDTGPEAVQAPGPKTVPSKPVQSEAVETVSEGAAGVPKFRIVTSFDPWFATTAKPVAVLIATDDGFTPTAIAEPICVGVKVVGGWTARFTAAIDPFVEPETKSETVMG